MFFFFVDGGKYDWLKFAKTIFYLKKRDQDVENIEQKFTMDRVITLEFELIFNHVKSSGIKLEKKTR